MYIESGHKISLDSSTEYSEIENTREQLFHAWRLFHFNENTETLDSYVTSIRHVATLLGYGDPQLLDVFKKYTPHKIILGTFSNRRYETSRRNR